MTTSPVDTRRHFNLVSTLKQRRVSTGMIGRDYEPLKVNNSNRFKAKENKRVMKTVVLFEKLDTNAKCYCPEGFHAQLHWLIDVPIRIYFEQKYCISCKVTLNLSQKKFL